MTHIQGIKINRKDISQAENIRFPLPDKAEMADGTVLLKLDVFSLSTNNITYAVTGNSLNYWGYFPVDEQHSQLPVWGFGQVLASKHPKFKPGDRFYGYFPMSSHVLVQPDKVNAFGFVDANPKRVSNNPIYNHYMNMQSDVAYRPNDEAMQSLFRPLFITSFLLDDFLNENNNFGAQQILITSASSKTSYGLASILHKRKTAGKTDVSIVGMTSDSNTDFVHGLEMYDEVITYDKYDALDNSKQTVIIDFTGNQRLLKKIAAHLGAAHAYTSLIGAVQNDQLDDEAGAVKHGKFFFAPIQAQKCIARDGHAEFNKQYAETLDAFIQQAKTWLSMQEVNGVDNVRELYLQLLSKSPPPEIGYVASI